MTLTEETASPIYSCLASDPDLSDLVDSFIQEMPSRIEKIRCQFESGNWEELQGLAHQLRGAFGGYGFDAVTPITAQLERTLQSGPTEDQVRAAVQQLIEICHRLRAGTPR